MKLAAGTTVFTGGQLIDGTGAAPVCNGTLVVTDGRIAYAGPTAQAPRQPPDATRIEVRGGTIMPGLVEAHYHPTILARYGRVKLAEPIAESLKCELIVYVIGERPGGDALASRSLSAYFIYQLLDPAAQQTAAPFSGNVGIRFEYSVLSNIYGGGLPPLEAGGVIVDRVGSILARKAAGNRLESLLKDSAA